MLRARRHRFAAGAAIVLSACLASSAARAQDVKLVSECAVRAQGEAQPPPASAPRPGAAVRSSARTTANCELRAADAVVFKGVKATLKGRTEPLEVQFTPFDPREQSIAVLFLIQIMEPGRRSGMSDLLEAVVKMAEPRDGKRRYAAYSMGNDLNPVVDFGAAKAEFDKQVRAVKSARLTMQLFKNALAAIAKLSKEPADRKALVILGDGTYDDPAAGYDRDQVVKAAKDAGVVIHVLGYVPDAADLPKFQSLRRLADDTGGFRREVRVGGVQRYQVGSAFVGEVLENGGAAAITLEEPQGPTTVSITVDFTNGRFESVDQTITLPTPAAAAQSPRQKSGPPPAGESAGALQRLATWVRNNTAIAAIIGAAFCLGIAGAALFAFSSAPKQGPGGGAAATDKQGRAVVYGWLEMLDSNASRYPLRTTNARIGRHRDNDVCLQNDSISRRHAVLHFNADNRSFVITDLGGGNGVIVNKIKQQSHELKDGDLVELGEVRLRFRANKEVLG